MNRIFMGVMATGIAAVLAACAPEVKTEAVSGALEPMEAKRFEAGDRWVYLVNGKEEVETITAVDGDLYSGANLTTGCEYTFFHAAFGPAKTFTNCNGSSGTQEVERSGSIFPLTVGASESWDVSGRNTKGDTWDTTRSCEVEGTARVTVPAGTFDTYHVVCNDTWRVRERWVAPELGFSVIRRDAHKERGEVKTRELVSFTPAASS